MSKKELRSADARKSKKDPNQQQKSGAAKPTYVATDKKKKVSEDYYKGTGEKVVARTKKYMKKKGEKGAPGLDAMKARQKDHKERRGVKKKVNEDMSKLPGLGGGGGGTNAITMKSSAKSAGKRIKDIGKAATTPVRAVLGIKSKPDPREKFASEEVMAVGPTNNASGNEIAGLPPDNPPVKKKKKRYVYGGTGSRKMWMS